MKFPLPKTEIRNPALESNMLNGITKAIREQLEEGPNWKKLYSISWLYVLAQSLSFQKDNIYNLMRNAVLSLLKSRENYIIALYDHESAVGIIFSLYHLADENNLGLSISEVLKNIEALRWHDYDSELMIFSYMLAIKINAKEYANNLLKNIKEHLDRWFQELDYESQKSIAYALFGFAYASDKELIKIVKKFNLITKDNMFLQRLMNGHDVENIALVLFTFGKLAYNKKLFKKLKHEAGMLALNTLRFEIIPQLGRILDIRISEEGMLEDLQHAPPELLAKIQLARIESGLEKPFMLSKYEWEIYQEVLKSAKEGFFGVNRKHLALNLILTAVIPSLIIVLLATPLYHLLIFELNKIIPGYAESVLKIIAFLLFNELYGINLSLWRNGFIRKEYLLGVLKHIPFDVINRLKRGAER